jgi:hypothetical protein
VLLANIAGLYAVYHGPGLTSMAARARSALAGRCAAGFAVEQGVLRPDASKSGGTETVDRVR